jgi:hypothetical protein
MFVVRQLATPAAPLTFFSPRGRFRPGAPPTEAQPETPVSCSFTSLGQGAYLSDRTWSITVRPRRSPTRDSAYGQESTYQDI